MRSSVKNQAQLREFLTTVRTQHGLNVREFGDVTGLKSMFRAFDRGEKQLGSHSIRIIAQRLSLDRKLVAALLDPNAPPAKFPPPESITLAIEGEPTVANVLIDVEAAKKMMSAISAAGKPMALSALLQLIH